ncbi:MAG: hypothetical protein OXB94_11135, partial [Nitrospira sp.]|nr:hypothetical protein [Nitrospira sp.]
AFSPWRANARPSLFQPAQANPGGGITRAESHLSTACNLFKETEPPLSARNKVGLRLSLAGFASAHQEINIARFVILTLP